MIAEIPILREVPAAPIAGKDFCNCGTRLNTYYRKKYGWYRRDVE
jgi:hypothetical protein